MHVAANSDKRNIGLTRTMLLCGAGYNVIMNPNAWGQVIVGGVLGLAAIAILSRIAHNPTLSPNLRFIAQTAEGQLVQDLETGLLHILV